MNRQGVGAGSVIVAFVVAALAVRFVEVAWPYLLAATGVLVIAAILRLATRGPAPPPPLNRDKLTGKWAQHTRMTDAERAQVEYALRDAAADGRLDAQELEDRLVQAVRAKVWADVAPLFADL